MSDEQNNNQNSLPKTMEEYINKKKAESMTKEEYFERIKPHIIRMPFRLEMIYIPEKDMFIIQGDENGLKRLGESILGVAHPAEVAGFHVHWDRSTTTYINIKQLIVQRVNTDNDDGIVNHG
jgi:hypothetical protein